MANPDLGTKRECPACGARFYDLKKSPAVCPKCAHETVFDGGKPKRAKPAAKAAPAATETEETKPAAEEGELAPDERTVSLQEVADGEESDDTVDEDDVDAELLALGDDDLEEEDTDDDSDVFLEEDEDEDDDVSGLVKTVASDD